MKNSIFEIFENVVYCIFLVCLRMFKRFRPVGDVRPVWSRRQGLVQQTAMDWDAMNPSRVPSQVAEEPVGWGNALGQELRF